MDTWQQGIGVHGLSQIFLDVGNFQNIDMNGYLGKFPLKALVSHVLPILYVSEHSQDRNITLVMLLNFNGFPYHVPYLIDVRYTTNEVANKKKYPTTACLHKPPSLAAFHLLSQENDIGLA